MSIVSSAFHRSTAAVGVAALVLSAMLVGVPSGPAVAADPPVAAPLPVTVSADGLPTVQIDGVVWKQLIVGRTVYVGGKFTNARPAGAAAGTNLVARANMLAYNLDTGELITSFNPVFNNQVKDLAVSADGTKLYAVGNFTTVNGATRNRVAAFDLPSGALSSFAPSVNSYVTSVAVSGSRVYVGGAFSAVNGQQRLRVAAVDAATGAVLPFSVPVDDYQVQAIVVAPDNASIVISGNFTSIGGESSTGYGLGRLDATTGALLALPVNAEVRNAGDAAAIGSLSTNGTYFYGTGWHYGGGGNVEGSFAASWATGELVWLEDCHGDTYSAFAVGDVVYLASHKHYCGNSGGFPQTTPWSYHHGTAVTNDVRGTNTADIYGYPDHPGTPRPEFLEWYPVFAIGTFTGQNQGPWTVSGNNDYVLFGGEFLRVNNVPQQGLVRFARRDIAPNKLGPVLKDTAFPLSAVSYA
ncbi:MAG: NHL repeat-containing protein, partial [Cellulomonas sp.]